MSESHFSGPVVSASGFVGTVITTVASVNGTNITYTGKQIVSGLIMRGPSADSTDTLPEASAILAVLPDMPLIATGFETTIKNMSAFTITLASSATVFLQTPVTIAPNALARLLFGREGPVFGVLSI